MVGKKMAMMMTTRMVDAPRKRPVMKMAQPKKPRRLPLKAYDPARSLFMMSEPFVASSLYNDGSKTDLSETTTVDKFFVQFSAMGRFDGDNAVFPNDRLVESVHNPKLAVTSAPFINV
eukprot:TRINITY_DN17089_c0_g1_i1.p2 TRINITY_DN17089_c0_g1~~TRINITY_DN17089_c0_g1_i1.p2  ORF type:complete len:118 (-),score=31.03 TRINITY_DN17089_c0_g1_i1:506-859(-)